MNKSTLLPVLIVCFGPAVFFLLLGSLVLLPFQIYGIAGPSSLHWEGPLGLIAMIAGGLVGLAALFSLTIRLLGGGEIDRPYLVVVGAIIGIVSAIPAAAVAGPVSIVALGLLPLLGTAYILIASRHLLFPLIKPSIRPFIPSYVWVLAAIPMVAVGALIHMRSDLSRDDLVARREFWLQSMPASYSYDLSLSGKLDRPPRRVSVHNNQVVLAEYLNARARANIDSSYAPAITTSWTMTTVFDKLVEAEERGDRVRALFDDNLGFVKRASVEEAGSHYGWDLTVLNFEPSGQQQTQPLPHN